MLHLFLYKDFGERVSYALNRLHTTKTCAHTHLCILLVCNWYKHIILNRQLKKTPWPLCISNSAYMNMESVMIETRFVESASSVHSPNQ